MFVIMTVIRLMTDPVFGTVVMIVVVITGVVL